MRYLLPVALLACAGCATPAPIQPTARHFTIQHGSGIFNSFSSAMATAETRCAGMDMDARHLGTDYLSQYRMLSRFECVAR